ITTSEISLTYFKIRFLRRPLSDSFFQFETGGQRPPGAPRRYSAGQTTYVRHNTDGCRLASLVDGPRSIPGRKKRPTSDRSRPDRRESALDLFFLFLLVVPCFRNFNYMIYKKKKRLKGTDSGFKGDRFRV
ncbi:hypothetical protein, partial [Pseudomonas syringae group genomosp. 3]